MPCTFYDPAGPTHCQVDWLGVHAQGWGPVLALDHFHQHMLPRRTHLKYITGLGLVSFSLSFIFIHQNISSFIHKVNNTQHDKLLKSFTTCFIPKDQTYNLDIAKCIIKLGMHQLVASLTLTGSLFTFLFELVPSLQLLVVRDTINLSIENSWPAILFFPDDFNLTFAFIIHHLAPSALQISCQSRLMDPLQGLLHCARKIDRRHHGTSS